MEEAAGHARAHRWLAGRLSGSARVGLPWQALTGFIRIAAQPRAWERPVPIDTSVGIVRSWLSRPPAWTPEPGPSHIDILATLLGGRGSPRQVADAHLAAIAIEHGLTICSLDHDSLAGSGPACGGRIRWPAETDARRDPYGAVSTSLPSLPPSAKCR